MNRDASANLDFGVQVSFPGSPGFSGRGKRRGLKKSVVLRTTNRHDTPSKGLDIGLIHGGIVLYVFDIDLDLLGCQRTRSNGQCSRRFWVPTELSREGSIRMLARFFKHQALRRDAVSVMYAICSGYGRGSMVSCSPVFDGALDKVAGHRVNCQAAGDVDHVADHHALQEESRWRRPPSSLDFFLSGSHFVRVDSGRLLLANAGYQCTRGKIKFMLSVSLT